MESFDIGKAIDIASNIISIAAIIASMTPTPADDGIFAVARKLIDILAFNIGHAKNSKD